MSSINLHKTTKISTTKKKRKPNTRIINPAITVAILSCILLTGGNHNFVGAIESPIDTPTKRSTSAFLRKKTPFAEQRKIMSTRSGTRYRGGAAEPSDATSAETISSTAQVSIADATAAPSTASAPTTAELPATAAETKSTSFSWRDARRTLFPIHGKDEVQKFLLIGSIKFFIIMALTLTRDTKDTLVVTQCGAEAIAFLKVRDLVSTCE